MSWWNTVRGIADSRTCKLKRWGVFFLTRWFGYNISRQCKGYLSIPLVYGREQNGYLWIFPVRDVHEGHVGTVCSCNFLMDFPTHNCINQIVTQPWPDHPLSNSPWPRTPQRRHRECFARTTWPGCQPPQPHHPHPQARADGSVAKPKWCPWGIAIKNVVCPQFGKKRAWKEKGRGTPLFSNRFKHWFIFQTVKCFGQIQMCNPKPNAAFQGWLQTQSKTRNALSVPMREWKPTWSYGCRLPKAVRSRNCIKHVIFLKLRAV